MFPPSTAREILASFPGRRVLVVGDVMLDESIWGDMRRISPEAPVPIVEIERRTLAPGGAANVAASVAGLGAQVLLAGVVGHDFDAERLRDALAQMSIDPAGLIVDLGRPTTTRTRIIARGQQVVRADFELRGPLGIEIEDLLLQMVEKALAFVDVCVLSDYDKGLFSSRVAAAIIQMARRAGLPVVVDPDGTNYVKYRGAMVITPSIHKAERAVQREIIGDHDLFNIGDELAALLPGTTILITHGQQDMSLFSPESGTIDIPGVAPHVFDATGASDAIVSTLAIAIAAGAALEQAARLANHAAAIVVSKVGTGTVTTAELLAELERE